MADGSSTLRDPLSVGTRADELTGDDALLAALVTVELAMSRAAVVAGLAPDWMLDVCDDLEGAEFLSVAEVATAARAGGNPVIPLVGALRAAADTRHPGAGDHIHPGATSQDVMDTATSLIARDVLDEVIGQSLRFARLLAGLATQHRATPMVGRTLGQHASPTTLGYVVAGWLDQTLRSVERMVAAREALPVQWGGSVGDAAVLDRVGTGGPDASRPIGLLAEQLGLAEPAIAWHSDRSVVAELGSALSLAIGAAGRFALDVSLLARTEAGELSERPADGAGGSSAMPHKSNPITAVLIVGAARRAPGQLSTLHAALLGEDQRSTGAWHSEWSTLADLERIAISTTTGAADLAARLDVHPVRMRANLDLTRGLVSSELVTAVLADALGRSDALALVGRAMTASGTGGFRARVLAEISDDTLRERVGAALDSGATEHSGSTASRSIDAAIDRLAAVARVASATGVPA